jgi:hypothetical protein
LKRREEKEENNKRKRSKNKEKKNRKKLVRDPKILPKGSAKMRWVGRRAGDLIASAVQWKEKSP